MVEDGHDGRLKVGVARGQHVVVDKGEPQPATLLKARQVHLISVFVWRTEMISSVEYCVR